MRAIMSNDVKDRRILRRWLLLALVALTTGLLAACSSVPPQKAPTAPVAVAAPTPPHAVDVRWLRRTLSADEAADYVGDAACASCHPQIAKQQARTRHAGTLRAVTVKEDGSYFHSAQKLVDKTIPATYSTLVKGGECLMHMDSTAGKGDVPATWAIGSGKNARTFLSRATPGDWAVLRLTYYTGAKRWNYTPAQEPGADLPTVAGKIQTEAEVVNCLSCHVTVMRAGTGEPDMTRTQPGVGCERCHGPGKAHVDSFRKGAVKSATPTMENLHTATPAYINKLCGACHRDETNSQAGDPHVEHDLARFEGVALARSACYLKSGALSCTTCHDPHHDADPVPAHTDRICLNCHAGPGKATAPVSAQGRICPVNPTTGCTPCHMPRQAISGIPYARFTQHWIKVWDNKK
ncbi:MAG: hypothetical protein JWL77_3953 [Chthonomonadaceae bacterium]|nr:hypothetical protein [Chthonomonadaceae bacterium]